jgi:regulator of nonsense transcripts 3
VREPQLLDELSAKVKQTQFQDAKNTMKDPCLLGPPSLEFALYTRVPGSRVRHDGRQGTIDQDQEFIDFLQSLTEPVSKPTNDTGAPDGKQDKTTTTPLVQFLKEKKAAKAKEAAAAKTAKAKEAKEAKSEKAGKTTVVVKNAPPSAEKARLAKATQDAVKAINKSVASMQGKASPQKTDAKTGSVIPASKESAPPSARPPRERGSAAVANRILQRDLGIVPKEVKTRSARPSGPSKDIEVTLKVEASAQNASSQSAQKSAVETAPITTPAPPTGPRNSRPPSAVSVKPSVVPASRPPKQGPQPTPGAKAAFLKHANASQGVTEELLRSAFEAFGPLTRCEIDKKKGFGYVDFSETEHLKLAMQASPVKIGNGQVVVLENKTRKIAPAAAVSTISAKSSSPPADTQPTAQPIAGTTSTKSDTAASSGSSSVLPADSTAQAASHTVSPRVPRGAPRGGPTFNRGRGGFAPGRANFSVQRGAARENFRGGRSNVRGTLAAPGSGTASPSTSVGASTVTGSATSNIAGATEKT